MAVAYGREHDLTVEDYVSVISRTAMRDRRPLANAALAGVGWLWLQQTDSGIGYLLAAGFTYANAFVSAFNLLPGLNEPDRNHLVIALADPDSAGFDRMYTLLCGPSEPLGCGPQWSYPCAVEYRGTLYITATSEKRHCVLLRVPVTALG